MFFYFPFVLNALRVLPLFCTSFNAFDGHSQKVLAMDFGVSCRPDENPQYSTMVGISVFVWVGKRYK